MATDIHRSIKQGTIDDILARLRNLEDGLSITNRLIDDIRNSTKTNVTALGEAGHELTEDVKALRVRVNDIGNQVDNIHTTVDNITQAE